LFRIASAQPSSPAFTDTGFAPLAVLPPDPQFDHVNMYWRWEMTPEAQAASFSLTTIGNSALEMQANAYANALVRITRGTGAGQERVILSNDAANLTVSAAWTTEPDATSYFVVSETSWRFGAKGSSSPIPIDVPERIGAGVQISARAANVNNEEASYAVSPLTRWVIGSSHGLASDSDVPPAPQFGVTGSATMGGGIDLGAIGFGGALNTTSITGGTYKFHLYDEINGAPPVALSAPVAATDTAIRAATPPASGAYIQIDGEVMLAGATDSGGNTTVQRGIHQTVAAAHALTSPIYLLTEKVIVVPFVKNFFGTPVSGNWKYSMQIPAVRIASAELFMTNSLGDGAVASIPLTDSNDNGLRTLAGGQYSFQVTGYLAYQTGAAPNVVVDATRVVGSIYGVLRSPSTGAGVTLQLNVNSVPYATVQFNAWDGQASTKAAACISGIVDGFGLPTLHPGDQISLDVVGVGTTNPGSDLTLVMLL
jgi:hypothetical protein